jgi:TPR repeat protein
MATKERLAELTRSIFRIAAICLLVFSFSVLKAKRAGGSDDNSASADAGQEVNLANRYVAGDGVPRDYAAALSWYQKAAAQGNADGETGVGYMYERGYGGVAQDYAAALSWYQKAAAQVAGRSGTPGSTNCDELLSLALSMTISFRMDAVIASFGNLPARRSRSCDYRSGVTPFRWTVRGCGNQCFDDRSSRSQWVIDNRWRNGGDAGCTRYREVHFVVNTTSLLTAAPAAAAAGGKSLDTTKG